MRPTGEDLQARNDRDRDTLIPRRLHEPEEDLVVVEELRDGVLGAGMLLLEQHRDVPLEIGRLRVLLRIRRDPDAEVRRRRLRELLEVRATVHRGHLTDELEGTLVRAATLRRRAPLAVAADRQDVLDPEVVQLDQRVLGLLAGEPVAEDVRDRIDVEAVLDRGAESERARRLARDAPAERPPGHLVPDRLARVTRDVDEGRLVRQQRRHRLVDAFDVPTAARGDDLDADQRLRRVREMLDHLHRIERTAVRRGSPEIRVTRATGGGRLAPARPRAHARIRHRRAG